MSDYKVLKLLGQGTFGKAYLCKNDKDGKYYVKKEMRMAHDDIDVRTFLHLAKLEIQVLKTLKHPNIVGYFGSSSGKSVSGKPFFCVIMEFADGGDISSYISERRRRGTVSEGIE